MFLFIEVFAPHEAAVLILYIGSAESDVICKTFPYKAAAGGNTPNLSVNIQYPPFEVDGQSGISDSPNIVLSLSSINNFLYY